LQRTQTYHLTSHSEYSQHLDNILPHYQHRSQPDIQEQPPERRLVERSIPVPNTLPLRERASRLPLHMQLQVSTDELADERRAPHEALSPLSHLSGYSQSNYDSVSMSKFSPLSQMDGKVKEKHWYETSLDSPSRSEGPALRKSASLKRTPSIGNSQTYEIMISSGRHSALQSPGAAHSPPVLSPGAVSLESPQNMTVIEQGKCIPYREETKPFEMSDFYKYSTKFRQANAPKPVAALSAHHSNTVYNKMPLELPPFNHDQWHGYSN
ncbi:jg10414, partial [Pararge aegeria aegeria]